jgi:hypothetical protein
VDVVPAILLVAAGYFHATTDFDERTAWRVTVWTTVGGALFAGVTTGTFLVRQMDGRTVAEPEFPLLVLRGWVRSPDSSPATSKRAPDGTRCAPNTTTPTTPASLSRSNASTARSASTSATTAPVSVTSPTRSRAVTSPRPDALEHYGGDVEATTNEPHGSVFTVPLPRASLA